MARTQQQQFSTIRTEGALLPPDVLQQIASGKAEGLRPADYHLPEGYKLNEAITQSWDLLKKHWKTFQEARAYLSDTDTGTEITNKHWLLPLFRELDYGHLATSPAPQIEDRSYPIERFYNHTPIHLVGCNLPLDRRTKGARGAATASPHSMVQEFLNRSEGHVWAIVTNGLRLRLLRDNVALSRQAFVEFDLEAMMEGEVYPDFALLWLLLHQSRVEAPKPEDCWLEDWSKLARESGTRILKQLRESVRTAIEALGQGFIAHARNDALREKLRSGTLSRDDYYRQLLRIVYRLLFLFVAEDRDLLHPPGASDTARDRYRRFYSLSRLRDMALKLRGSKHGDLWHGLSLVFAGLGNPDGCPTLGIVGLGSFLWTPDKTPDLNGPHEAAAGRTPVEIANDDLLTAVRALAYVEQDNVLRSVDYRNLGSEELGSVYESLLELHPDIEIDAQRFTLATAAGNQRKTSGSYYTPDSLVQCLLDSALDPVVEDRLKGKKGDDAQHAILDLTVCDPACGSGHFLIAAAHRLARHLARIRTGETEPSPEDHQTALRDVICRCIYGVDLNPMAVELCKVSLWMEAIEPGKPLSFLDHHIKCGNSLLGVTPRLLHEGIPEAAFTAIEGDDKTVVKELKQRHKKEVKDRTGGRQTYLFKTYLKLGNLAEEFVRVTTDPNDTATDIARKAELYAELVDGADYCNAKLLADTWCSAFVWKKDGKDLGKACPTERDFRECETNPHSLLPHVRDEVARLANEFSFFHWHLAFPEVFTVPMEGRQPENEQMGWDGGFDVMIGNPPWEKTTILEQEHFADVPDIANEKRTHARRALIRALEADDPLRFAIWMSAKRAQLATEHLVRDSGLYPRSAVGELNLYPMFAEHALYLHSRGGRCGMVVKSALLLSPTWAGLCRQLVDEQRLRSAFDFRNWNGWFPAIGFHERFTLLTYGGQQGDGHVALGFYFDTPSDRHSDKVFSLTAAQLQSLNPVTRTIPVLQDKQCKDLLLMLYAALPVLADPKSGWQACYTTGFHTSGKSEELRSKEELQDEGFIKAAARYARADGRVFFPLMEGKLLHQFNARFASFERTPAKTRFGRKPATYNPRLELANPYYETEPRYWVASETVKSDFARRGIDPCWAFAFRDTTNVISNRRTAVATIQGGWCFGYKSPNLSFDAWDQNNRAIVALDAVGLFNSFIFDFVIRQKFFGANLIKSILDQAAIIPHETARLHSSFLRPRLLELSFTTEGLRPWAALCGATGSPFRWSTERRASLRCELDALYFHLFLGASDSWASRSLTFDSPRKAVEYIMETFPIVKKKDVAKYGSYRTKEQILAIYDEMAECIAKGTQWKSPLDPPPGDPRAAWTEEEMEMWRAGRGDELIEKYGLLDDADDLDESDPDQDAEAEDPADAEAEAVE
jgi:hypothetical protein